jgi:uncharacterized protein (TIGR03000 family)
MKRRIRRLGWLQGVLPAGVLAALLVGWYGTAASPSGPLDAPESLEPRVPAAKLLSFPGLFSSKGVGQAFSRNPKGTTLYTRDLLVAVPGFKVQIEPAGQSVGLTMWGNLPGQSDSPVLESVVVLHDSKAYDLDFTLVRGRVVLTNTKKAGPAKVWLRATKAAVELVLPEPGDQVALEIYGRWPAGESFSLKRRPGEGPVQLWQVYCLKGQLEIKAGQTRWGMAAPPGACYFHGDSKDGPNAGGPERRAKLPAWADPAAKPSPLAKKVQAVVDAYTSKLQGDDAEEAGAQLLAFAEKDPDKERAAMTRTLVTYALAAADRVGEVAKMLNDSPDAAVRHTAVVALRHWIGSREGRDEKLYVKLQEDLGFTRNEAETVLQMLHSPFAPDQPETYETLIAYLKHRRQAVRELAAWHLVRLAPAGRKIAFDAAAPAAQRDKAANEWKKLIPSGELPKDADETKEKPKETPKETPKEKPKETPKEKPQEKRPPQEKAGGEESAVAQPATVVVRLGAEATLTFDGQPTQHQGLARYFVTPPLRPGKRYFYVVAATWYPDPTTTITRTRKVYVRPGQSTEVDLRTADPRFPDKVVRRGV